MSSFEATLNWLFDAVWNTWYKLILSWWGGLSTEKFQQKGVNEESSTRRREPFSKKCDILGIKNEKKIENSWYWHPLSDTNIWYWYPTDIQVLKNSTLQHKMSRLGGGGRSSHPRGVLRKRCSENMQQIYEHPSRSVRF